MQVLLGRLVICAVFCSTTAVAGPVQEQSATSPEAKSAIFEFQDYKAKDCPVSDASIFQTCKLRFNVVPKKTVAEYSNVSCYMEGRGADVQVLQLLINQKDGEFITAQTLIPVFTSSIFDPNTKKTLNSYATNLQISAFAGPGQVPVFALSFVATEKNDQMNLYCHLHGTYFPEKK